MKIYGKHKLAFSLMCLLLPVAALAQSIKVENARARATVEGQQAGGAFATLLSDAPVAITGASSPRASSVEIHEMVMVGNVMKMRALPRLMLPKGTKVELKPGGNHLMFIGLKQPLKAGETVPITLTVEREDKTTTKLLVEALVQPTADPGQGQMQGQGKHHH